MAILSLNNHYTEHVDHQWPRNLPIRPDVCFEAIFSWLQSLDLDRNTIHTVVMPGVREGIVLTAYHTLLGHFPNAMYSRREGEGWVWDFLPLQKVREEYRGRRYAAKGK